MGFVEELPDEEQPRTAAAAEDSEDIEILNARRSGNERFAAGDFAGAIAAYGRGISAAGEMRRSKSDHSGAESGEENSEESDLVDGEGSGEEEEEEEHLPEGVTRLTDDYADGDSVGKQEADLDKGDGDNETGKATPSMLARDTSALETNAVKKAKANCPKRLRAIVAPLYCNRAACNAKLGKWRESLRDAVCAFALDPLYVKALLRAAQAREEIEQLRQALRDYQQVAEMEPGNIVAKEALRRLPARVAEQEERDKAEMLGKLKDLGNSFLGLFGMSTDNFQFVKDDNGGYSVNFNQNPKA